MSPGFLYPGRHRAEADQILRFCVERGMSWKRSYVMAAMASVGRVSWIFQATIAKLLRISVRTVQRACRQAKRLGIIVSRRLRRNEQPEGAAQPISCGGALRRFVGWGLRADRMRARCLTWAVRWTYREAALERRRERERAELDAAIGEFRELGPPD